LINNKDLFKDDIRALRQYLHELSIL